MKVWIEELGDFLILPIYKSQMVYWLACKYPADKKKFERWNCKRLRATICSIVRREARLRRIGGVK